MLIIIYHSQTALISFSNEHDSHKKNSRELNVRRVHHYKTSSYDRAMNNTKKNHKKYILNELKKIPVLFDFNETSHMMMMRDRILTRACARETSIWTKKKNLMNSRARSQHIQLNLEDAPRARLGPTGSLPFRWSQINLFNFIKIDVWLEWSDARENRPTQSLKSHRWLGCSLLKVDVASVSLLLLPPCEPHTARRQWRS